jgi:hypothetical protein
MTDVTDRPIRRFGRSSGVERSGVARRIRAIRRARRREAAAVSCRRVRG